MYMKKIIQSRISVYCLLFMMILTICVLRSVVYDADFIPTNGTFQNYNPVRRLLDGQTPYVDFSLYLGFGHLYLGSITTLLFGGRYTDSVMAFRFLTYFFTSLFVVILGKSILKTPKKLFIFALLSTVFLSLIDSPVHLPSLRGTVPYINSMLSVGNSARIIRGFAPAFCVIILLVGYYVLKKLTLFNTLSDTLKSQLLIIGYSFVGAIAFIFSNDYGISAWLCLFVSLLIVAFSRNKTVGKTLIYGLEYIGISITGILLLATLFTKGNPQSWFTNIFGIGSFQTFYFLSPKSYHIYNLDFSFTTIIQLIVSIVYFVLIYINRGTLYSVKRYGIPAFLNLTSFCAVNEYKLLSGSYLHEVSTIVLFTTLLLETINFIIIVILRHSNVIKCKTTGYAKMKTIAIVLSIVIGISWCVCLNYFNYCKLMKINDEHGDSYIESLGGFFPEKSDDLVSAADFLGEKKVWSTYASAVECMTNQYQPSGYDYIIHALGEKSRNEYLSEFQSKDFTYAATITPEGATAYYYWINSANWFFTKELYKNWHPVFGNSYEIFWAKNTDKENYIIDSHNISVECKKENESEFKIILRGASDINGIADVSLSYTSQKNSSPFLWFSHIRVLDTNPVQLYEGKLMDFNLPEKGNAINIPINIINGYGEITVSSEPEDETFLNISDVKCNEIYAVEYNFAYVLSINKHENNDNCIIEIENSSILQRIQTPIKYLKIGSKKVKVEQITVDDRNKSLLLVVKSSQKYVKSLLGKNNYVEILVK